MTYELTTAELEEQLRNQLDFLRASAEAFDSGSTAEAARLATVIRVLVHDTRSSHSLLSQLGLKDSIRFVNTAPDLDGIITPLLTRMELWTDGSTKFQPRLDDLFFTPTEVPFDDWWNATVISDEDGVEFSRRHLVLAMANKEGGAHVDPELEPEYAALSRSGSLGWVIVDAAGERPMLENPIPSSVRQIAAEVELTLVGQVPGIVGT